VPDDPVPDGPLVLVEVAVPEVVLAQRAPAETTLLQTPTDTRQRAMQSKLVCRLIAR